MKKYCEICQKELKNYKAKRCRLHMGELISKKIKDFIKNNGIKNYGRYIDGRSLVQHYCIDCKKQITSQAIRCYSCNIKYLHKNQIINFKNKNNPFYGKHHTKETRKIISLRGGGTGIPYENNRYGNGWTESLKEEIRFRDNYKCKICGLTNEEHLIVYNFSLPIHHIDYNKKNNLKENLVSVCSQCHARTNYNRSYWKEFFYVLFQTVSEY